MTVIASLIGRSGSLFGAGQYGRMREAALGSVLIQTMAHASWATLKCGS